MQNVVLIIHLLLAVTLIGLVLLQRSEGGGLGMGGGGGGGGAMSGRAAASAITKLTWLNDSSSSEVLRQLSSGSVDANYRAIQHPKCRRPVAAIGRRLCTSFADC